jgi:transcription-repair coupling factor (superfamily II helicase)
MHQLRGRVGRSHHQAYAYLLTDPDRKITPQAQKRLDAIQLMEDLGAGFHLAMHDLEIVAQVNYWATARVARCRKSAFHLVFRHAQPCRETAQSKAKSPTLTHRWV